MKNSENQSLWHWICVRILTLAIGSVLVIAVCMWLRFYLYNWWIIYHMPQSLREAFLPLMDNPSLNPTLFHQVMDEYWGILYSVPSIMNSDWLMVWVLVLGIIPFIVMLALRAARPLSLQFMHLATAARAVSKGFFSVRAKQVDKTPAELVQFTEDFNTMTQQLERYEKELRAANVAIAHELRSPLTAAIGRMKGMLDGVFPLEKSQLEMVMKQLKHLSQLTDDLHILSLADANQLTLNKSPLKIEELLKERVAWLKPQTEKAGMTVSLSSNVASSYVGDAFRLGQMFTILLENALRYAVDGGVLAIHVSQDPHQFSITFKDNGPGVSADFLPTMFERYTRAESSRGRHSGGSGLGLSIAKAICVAHGGEISASLPPEGGLLVTVILPIHQERQ